MYRLFIPTEKRQSIARGIWQNSDGKKFVDFLRFENVEKITSKQLKELCRRYSQEAIFFESINKASGRKNRAYCFYANGKKDVFNKRYVRFCDSITDLKHAIRQLIKKGIQCYTIEKRQSHFGHFVIFAWVKRTDNRKKRILKRDKLIKKLYQNISKKIGFGADISLSIKHKICGTGGRAKFYSNKIIVNPYILKTDRIKNGYGDSYYMGRGKKLDGIVLHNYKKCLRFVILHEIGHFVFKEKTEKNNTFLKYHNGEKRYFCEKYADSFALRYLNEV